MENKNLIDALERIKTESNKEAAQLWLFYNIATAKLVLPVAVDAVPNENGEIPENATVKYFSIKNTDGQIYLVTFTCYDFFQEWQPDIMKYHVEYEFSQIEKMVTRPGSGYAGIIIDPNHSNVVLPNDVLKHITSSTPKDTVLRAERFVTEKNAGLTPAENPPEKLISALKEYMATDKSILSAHIMQTIRKGETTPTLILVIDFLGAAKKVFDAVAKVAQDNMTEPQPVGIVPASDKVAQEFIKNVEPFYKK